MNDKFELLGYFFLNRMKDIFKLVILNILLFIALYVCSIVILKILSVVGASYGNTHSVAFAASLFAMVVLHLVSYRKRKKSN